MIKLSIIIPCYNEERYICKCLNSILNQNSDLSSYIEIIIVNDGSSDASVDVINSIVIERYVKNIKIIHTIHNGLANSRNIGIKNSSGNYIMFIDGDDWISNDCLKDIFDLILTQCPDVIIGFIEGVPENGIIREYSDPIDLKGLNENDCNFLNNMQSLKMKIAPSVKYIFNRSIIEKNKLLFKNIYHEDQLWSPLLLCYAKKYTLFKKHFYKYRLTNNGLSVNNSISVAIDYFSICEELYKNSTRLINREKKMFLYNRCLYLLRKIEVFSDFYTKEEKILLKYYFEKYKWLETSLNYML